jgi:translation initiation factor 2B subunit (eIF-2B alpha/beta/delta family)
MAKKIALIKSIKRNKVATSCANLIGSIRQEEQEFSLSKAVKRIANEINKILDHGHSREDVAAILSNGNIGATQEAQQSNNHISNIAIELLPMSEALTESPRFQAMASYNDSNRVPDHETRWNSH